MTEYDLGKVVGDDGEAGNGIASITKTGTSGLVDTYTITYDDGTTTTFTVTNGSNASVTIQTAWGSTTSDSKVPSEKLTKDSLDDKVSKSNTAGLLKNDGTVMTSGTGSGNYSAGNHTHSGYVSGSKVTSWSSTVSDSNVPSEKLTKDSLDDKVSKSSTSGLLKNDGTVDTNSYSTTSHTHGQVTSDGKVTSTAVTVASGDNILITDYSDSSKIKRVANILAGHVKDSTAHSNIGSSANDTQATINSDIDTALSGKQATLVSGTNIKTVNNESLLGSGNITIQGGSSVDVVTSWEATLSDSKVPSEKLVKNTIDGLSIPTKTSDLTNDGDGTNAFLTQHQSLSNYVQKSSTTGLIKNDGSIMTSGTGSTNYAAGNHTHSGYISTSSTSGLVKNDGSIMTGGTGSSNWAIGNHTHTGYVSATKVTSWQSTPSDSNVPSEKLVKDSLDDIEDLIGDAITYINQ